MLWRYGDMLKENRIIENDFQTFIKSFLECFLGRLEKKMQLLLVGVMQEISFDNAFENSVAEHIWNLDIQIKFN